MIEKKKKVIDHKIIQNKFDYLGGKKEKRGAFATNLKMQQETNRKTEGKKRPSSENQERIQ